MSDMTKHFELNAQLNLVGGDGNMQLHKDQEALRHYFREDVNKNTVFFHSLEEKLEYLIENDYYEEEVLSQYSTEFIKELFKLAYSKNFRFKTFVGAYKYYKGYTLKTFDGERYLERYEDRVCMAALYLAQGDETLAKDLVEEVISNRFQPATPTFLNAGRKQRGEMVSCFLLRIEDNMESIGRSITSALQLSKRGGGVAFLLSNIREKGAPIKNVEGQSSGIVPIMKMFEDAFSYANQLGSRSGAGAVYLNAHHPDIMEFLDTKRENADEKIRIKTLSTGVVIPDITYHLAKENKDMYLFSPYDVEKVYGKPFADIYVNDLYDEMVDNPAIRKTKIKARQFFTRLAQLQFESGYPFIMMEDNVARANPVKGKINMSNLCVAPETRILTDKGEKVISELEGVEVNVWNGQEWSPVTVAKTSPSERIYKVILEDQHGDESVLYCTKYHRWFLKDGSEVRTEELLGGDCLLEWATPESVGGNVRKHVVFDVVDTYEDMPVYCFTEHKRGMGVFNGILTGQCSEILQVNTPSYYDEDGSYTHIGKDISCNLGSMNVALSMESGDFGKTVETGVRGLTAVSNLSNIRSAPSVHEGNQQSHAIGLGQMNLHGFFAKEHMEYGGEESLDFTNLYFYTVAYHAYKASNKIAKETGQVFKGFEDSQYANGEYFKKYTEEVYSPKTEKVAGIFDKYGVHIPTQDDWKELAESIKEDGLYHSNLQAVPPTGSISYLNNSTASIHPVSSAIEKRKEGKLGLVYYPAPFLSEDNLQYYRNAYDVGPEKTIDVYAEATKHIDQGLSLTLFFPSTATTRDVNRAQIYAWRKGIKTLYYIRVKQKAMEGTEIEECVSCKL